MVGVAIVAALAVLFFAPLVPFSQTVGTGTNYPIDTLPRMNCNVPNSAVNPTLIYQGYESLSAYLVHSGVILYTQCYMPQ